MSQLSPDARAVVRAIDALTTQVRRAVDRMPTPVVQQANDTDDDATTHTDDGPRCVCGDPIELTGDPAGWIHSPGSDTRCLDARPPSWVMSGTRDLSIPEQRQTSETPSWVRPAGCEQHPTAGSVGSYCLACTIVPPPGRAEDAQRADRRASLRNLLGRAAAGLTPDEDALLRQHVEAEISEHDTMRAVAAGNKRHVQVMYTELAEAQAAIERVRRLCADPVHRFTIARADVLAALDGTEQPTMEDRTT